MDTQGNAKHFRKNRLGYIATIIGFIALISSFFYLEICAYVDPEPDPNHFVELVSDIASDIIVGNQLQLKDSEKRKEPIEVDGTSDKKDDSLLSKLKRKATGNLNKEKKDELSGLEVDEPETTKESLLSTIANKTKDKVRNKKEDSKANEAVTKVKLPSRFVFPSIIGLGLFSVFLGIVSLFKENNKFLGICAILLGLGSVLVVVAIHIMLIIIFLIILIFVMHIVGFLTIST